MLGLWGPNLNEFHRRLGTAEVRDRVENLYFAYLFVLRAVMKAGPLLQTVPYDTGGPAARGRRRGAGRVAPRWGRGCGCRCRQCCSRLSVRAAAAAAAAAGVAAEDQRTAELVQRLVNSQELQQACPLPFDEGRLWRGEPAPLSPMPRLLPAGPSALAARTHRRVPACT
jgi:ERO1-like protein alpha